MRSARVHFCLSAERRSSLTDFGKTGPGALAPVPWRRGFFMCSRPFGARFEIRQRIQCLADYFVVVERGKRAA